jgi:hypothetical protein
LPPLTRWDLLCITADDFCMYDNIDRPTFTVD